MAVDMSQETVLKTLAFLFGEGSDRYEKAVSLSQSGAKVTFGLFQFMIRLNPDQVFTAQLPVMSTKIAPNQLPQAQLQLIAGKLGATIDEAYAAKTLQPGLVANPLKGSLGDVLAAMGKVMPASEAETPANLGEQAKQAFAAKIKSKVSEPYASVTLDPLPDLKSQIASAYGGKKVEEVIALRDAKAVGQKVKGTSGSSVYNAVAIGPVNLAVKFNSMNCSIRAESKDWSDVIKKKLKEAGFTDNGSYFSMHLKLNGVSPMRAIGAVVYTLDLPFEAVGTNSNALFA